MGFYRSACFILAINLINFLVTVDGKDNDDVFDTIGNINLKQCAWVNQDRWNGDCRDQGPKTVLSEDGHTDDTKYGFLGNWLQWDMEYTLSWEDDANEPIVFTWSVIGADPVINKTLPKGQHSINFTFEDLASEASAKSTHGNSTEARNSNATVATLGSASEGMSELLLQRPGSDGTGVGFSSVFVLYENTLHHVGSLHELEASKHHKEIKNWKLGVGIGVGLGVPLLMAVAFMLGIATQKNRGHAASQPPKYELSPVARPADQGES